MARRLTVSALSLALTLLLLSAEQWMPATLVWPVLIGVAQLGMMWWGLRWGAGLLLAWALVVAAGLYSWPEALLLAGALLLQGGIPALVFGRLRLNVDVYGSLALRWFFATGVLLNSLLSALLALPVWLQRLDLRTIPVAMAMLGLVHGVTALVVVQPLLRFGTHWLPARGWLYSPAAMQRSIDRPQLRAENGMVLLVLILLVSGLSIGMNQLTLLPIQVVNGLFLIPSVALTAQRGYDGALLAASLSLLAALSVSTFVYGLDVAHPDSAATTTLILILLEMSIYYLSSLVVGLLIDAQRAERQRLTTLLTFDRTIASAGTQPALLNTMTTMLQHTARAALCTIWRYQPDLEQLLLLQATPLEQLPAILRVPLALSHQPALQAVLAWREPQILHSSATNQTGLSVLWLETGFVTGLLVPLWGAEQVFGLVGVFDDRPERRFAAAEVRLLEVMCAQAAVALEQQRLIEALREQTEQFNVVAHITTTLNATLDLDTVCHRIALQIARVVPYQWAAVVLEDPLVGGLGVIMSTGLEPLPYPLGELLPVSPLLAGRLRSATSQPVRLDLSQTGEPWGRRLAACGLATALLVPLQREDRWLGMLLLSSSDAQAFASPQQQLLVMLVRHMALAIANARLYAELDSAYQAQDAAQSVLLQSERLRSLGELSSGIAHDFNNLLAGILGHTQLLLLEASPSVSSTLQVIEQAARDGREMIQRIQQFARPRVAQGAYLDINQLLHDVLALTSPRFQRQAAVPIIPVLELAVLPQFWGIAHELRQIFTNLVLNAIDAMPQGGVLTVRTTALDSTICVEIQDTGQGMTSEVQAAIWQPFFSTKGANGTGMGLAMTHALVVQQYGGSVAVESTLGLGTTISLLLPVGATLLAPAQAARPAQASSAQQTPILVADHDPLVASALRGLLESWGYAVLLASSAAETLAQLEAHSVVMLIIDSNLPDQSLWTLASSARRDHAVLHIVVLSVWSERIAREQRSTTFDAVLPKPFEAAELRRTIRTLLETRSGVER